MRSRSALIALAVAGLSLGAAAAEALPKTDVIVLRNGDRITGEVEELDRGKLTFKTDDVGTLAIEWDKVRSVTAAATFEVQDLDGHQYFGSLRPAEREDQLEVVAGASVEALTIDRVVRIQRLGATFWKRLDGSFDAGVSYTSSSELLKIDLGARVVLNRPGHQYSIDGSSTMTRQPDVEDTRRNSLTLSYGRRFPNRWVAFGQTQLEQNRELGFDLRGSVTAGGGRYLLQARKQTLLAGLGFRVNRERPLDGETTTNPEVALSFSFDRFAYDFPKVDVYVSLTGFTSLKDWGRSRLELSARFKRELLRDFSLSLTLYESYDSRPPTAGTPHNDYGGSLGLSWTF